MISIRARLLCWLLPAFAAVCITAGIGVYFSTANELEAQLDSRLAELVDDIRFGSINPDIRKRLSAELFGPRKNTHDMPERKPSFENLPDDIYCEILSNQTHSNRVPFKTENLEDRQLPRPHTFTKTVNYYNAQLDQGETLRIRADRVNFIGQRGALVLIAVSRQETDATLARLLTHLLVGGIISCLALSGILIAALHLSLKPLRKLGEQAAKMNAESLDERFNEAELPADIRSIAERLNLLMAKLEESFARERRFSGDLAHELRTPLAAIRTTSEVAAKWFDQASSDDFCDIAHIAEQLQQTLDSLLLLARMESSTAEAIHESVEISALVRECLTLHTAAAENRNLTFNLKLNEYRTETDPRLLRIIVSNLINNAVAYAPDQSEITLTVESSCGLFRCTNAAPKLQSGDENHLFERLWRKDAARTESDHTGLGLSIAKSCAKVLNTTLTAELTDHHLSLTLREKI